MATQAAYQVEKALGHDDNAVTQQDVTTYKQPGAGDPNETMKALAWMAKNKVQMSTTPPIPRPAKKQSLTTLPVDAPKPKIIEDRDVILKVTGTTVCGSDLHLLHGTVVELSEGDILGHEFCGVVDQAGPGATGIEVGKRYVASFQIACGDCFFCKQKLSSQCEKTNSNTLERAMFGGRTAGIFGYSHFTGGFAGGQAEYVRVPYGDVNLLEIPNDVPDEKGE